MASSVVVKPPPLLVRCKGGAFMINLYGDLDEDNLASFVDTLRWIERERPHGERVLLQISSTGGCVYCAMAIVDLIQYSSLVVDTCAVGQCMSAAALVFSCGKRRFVAPRATIMLHAVSLDLSSRHGISEAATETAEAKRLNTLMWTTMTENCDQVPGFFQDREESHRGDSYITADEAIDLKLATHVGIPRYSSATPVRLELPPNLTSEEKKQ